MTGYISPAALPPHILERADVREALAAHDFGTVFQIARKYAGISYLKIANACDLPPQRVGLMARGEQRIINVGKIRQVADALRIPGAMIGLAARPWEPPHPSIAARGSVDAAMNGEFDAIELERRAAASDVGSETLESLEHAFDDVAVAYSATLPRDLLTETRRYLTYVAKLFDARKTLDQHRRLVVVGGWFSLMSATLHIDLGHHKAAVAHLRTTASLARQAEHPELEAWCHETEAWRVLSQGDYPKAITLSQAAQSLAPKGSSVAIQATAQEGRAYARLGQPRETYRAITRVHEFVSSLPRPDRPEHHYRYDPNKSTSYTATTLAWVGDPAAEDYAREVIARLTPTTENGRWSRRAAVANLDLALTLLINERLDEACHVAQQGILSGGVVPSNYWRAHEVVRAVDRRGPAEAADLRAAYEVLTRSLKEPG